MREHHQGSTSGERLSRGMTFFAFVIVLVSVLLAPPSAQAETYNVLYTFTGGTDGAFPYAGLISDLANSLFGTAYQGGAYGFGVVFRLDPSGVLTVLHSFNGTDGASPQGVLTRDARGLLYGTTTVGGVYGYGTIFKLDPVQGAFTVLHNFNSTEGAYPSAGLIRDTTGNLYGTTLEGGDLTCNPPYGCGSVYQFDRTGSLNVVHIFNGADGSLSHADLVRDTAGNLYGTTQAGGFYNYGVVFQVDTTNTFSVLHSFYGNSDGRAPVGGLTSDGNGNLYGTTSEGGLGGHYGNGLIFERDSSGIMWGLYYFHNKDGLHPSTDLVRDSKGVLYGMTRNFDPYTDAPTAFKFDPATGRFKMLHIFSRITQGGWHWTERGTWWEPLQAREIMPRGRCFELRSTESS